MPQIRRLNEEEIAECQMRCGMLWITDESSTVYMCVLQEGHENDCMPQYAVGTYRPKIKRIK